tara:strand:- start:1193 stop:1480 length:288 start_codon:yes stop_codon:yes gene_type:complete
MKQVPYILILILSCTFIFSQEKTCCKNKAGKGKVSCKLNQANIDINNNSNIKSPQQLQIKDGSNVNLLDNKNCNGCKKNTEWWKFWIKKIDCCKA